ncbi:MAG TPA: alpha/beta hydrolase [Anaerolineaceae bacterium]
MKINVNGLSTYYEVQGKGSPVVLLHGWAADSGSLRAISTLLKNDSESRVYVIDLPGFGYSDAPPEDWNVGAYADFLGAFLQGMDLEAVSLLGHSFGGRIAIKFTAQHPGRVERLVLVDSAGIKPKRKPAYYYKVGLAKILKFVRKTIPALQTSSFNPNLGSADYQKAGALRGTMVKVVNEDLRPFLPQIQQPTLLIWGENDQETPLTDAFLMKELIPNSSLEIIKNAGHFCFLDNFAAFQTILLGFMRENRS